MISTVTASRSRASTVRIDSVPQGGGIVSVIIPTYNHAQYVGDAIQSVLDQEYRNFEIIVVDDGSTDDSQAVVAEFGAQVRYIWQENRGLSAARNTGIEAANGAYISLLDADDMLEPRFLGTLVSILEAEPDFAGVYCGYQFVGPRVDIGTALML
jgi:glycosyltransferase involved in cell wall biosynthesis